MIFVFFKQKTAYEMRISDWSSDVCSSDLLGARLQVGGLLDEEGCGRGLGFEREAAIRIDGNDRRDRHALFKILRLRVERLAELHDVDAALAQRRADRRRRVRSARRHLQLDVTGNLLCHLSSPFMPRKHRGDAV